MAGSAASAQAPGVGLDQPVDGLQEGGLAGARRTDQGQELARRHAQRDGVERQLSAIALRHPVQLDPRAAHASG
jgi:hypothetical protein